MGAKCNWLDQRGIYSRYGDSGWQLVLVLIGFLIMIISLVPGAQFCVRPADQARQSALDRPQARDHSVMKCF